MPVKGYSLSVIGSREKNQDSMLVHEPAGLFAVADGVGGGLKGEVASSMAVEGLKMYAPAEGSLEPVITRLQEDILREAIETLGDALMGTTLTAIRIKDYEVTLGHVGDSHCYLFTDSHLDLKTEDHETFDDNYGGPVLSSYLGMPTDTYQLRIQNEVFSVKSGDRLLLCSDGLYRQISEQRIKTLMVEHLSNPEQMLTALCAEASAHEYSDNVSVVLVEIS